MTLNPQYVTDRNGRKTSVLLSIDDYNRLMNELDLLEDIKLYKKAKARKSEFIPAAEVFLRIENKRRRK